MPCLNEVGREPGVAFGRDQLGFLVTSVGGRGSIFVDCLTVASGSGPSLFGDNLDTERVVADYRSGVLSLRIPVAERAKPRKITIGTRDETWQAISA